MMLRQVPLSLFNLYHSKLWMTYIFIVWPLGKDKLRSVNTDTQTFGSPKKRKTMEGSSFCIQKDDAYGRIILKCHLSPPNTHKTKAIAVD